MAIEKMSLVYVEGPLKKVNKTLIKCCESNCFHIIPSSHEGAGQLRSSRLKSLKDRNVYAPLLKRVYDLAEKLEIKPRLVDYDDLDMNVSIDFSTYIKEIEAVAGKLFAEQTETKKLLEEHSQALMQVESLAGLDVDFAKLFDLKYVSVRFGRLPAESFPKLRYYEDRQFFFFPYGEDEKYVWGVYFTPRSRRDIIDDIFQSLYFERVRIPDYLHGDADAAKTAIIKLTNAEREKLDTLAAQITEYSRLVSEKFLKVFCKLKTLSDSAELRSDVTVVNNTFLLEGFIPECEKDGFLKLLGEVEGLSVNVKPHDSEPMQKPPVKLHNCWLFRPFEMFVKMYGLPSYNGIDPTPFVAVTYMLIYGIMFGDLGQGLVISAFGILLWCWKKVKLGAVMSRIGISSALFGTLYGSVFGNEEIIKPFFKFEPIYKAMGMDKAPSDIFQISSYLLIAALLIGVILIIISMSLNIVISLKNHDLGSALLSPNGVTGAVLYLSVLVGAGLQLGFGIGVFSTPYVLCLIILPLCVFFFREPLEHLLGGLSRKNAGRKLNKNTALLHAVKSYSDAITRLSAVENGGCTMEQLLESKYVFTSFGRLKFDNYQKLSKGSESFLFFPFEREGELVSGVCFAPRESEDAAMRLLNNLEYEPMKMPPHISDLNREMKQYLKQNGISTAEKAEKKSVGTFIIEGVIECFESCLTYITNTMSFLRVGGFILSHAGMMLVVSVLMETAGGGVGGIVVSILGNVFVIGMEGFLVGIQVLRLEFYEIFSRFYKGDGKPFTPIMLELDYNK